MIKRSILLVFCAGVLPAGVIPNAGFELGTFPASAPSFAGGKGAIINGSTPAANRPQDWSYAGNGSGNPERWVQSTAAKQGNYYFYLSGSGTAFAGNDDCLAVSITGLLIGEIYGINAWVAAAQPTPARAAIEVQSGGGPLQYTTFDLPANTAWSDLALTVIPWQQVTMYFTAASTSATMWISAQTLSSTFTSVLNQKYVE